MRILPKHPEAGTANRKFSAKIRTIFGLGGVALASGCLSLVPAQEVNSASYGALFEGTVIGVALAGSIGYRELSERFGRRNQRGNDTNGNGGGGWEPPHDPAPKGPGGIPEPVDTDWIAQIEEYLAAEIPVSV